MNAQLDIFAPYQAHSETSRSAADAIKPLAKSLRNQVLEYIKDCGAYGATDEEIQGFLRINPSTQRPRRIELVQRQLICDSGRVRQTRSRRLAVVWEMKKAPGVVS